MVSGSQRALPLLSSISLRSPFLVTSVAGVRGRLAGTLFGVCYYRCISGSRSLLPVTWPKSLRRRPLSQGSCLRLNIELFRQHFASLAVLSRETVVAVVCVVGLLELTDLIRRRRPLQKGSIWLMPLVVFGVWHLFVAADGTGVFLTSAGNRSLRVLVLLLSNIPEVFSRNYLGEATLNVIHAMEVVVLLAVVGAAAMPGSQQQRESWSAFCGLLLLLLSADVPVGVWMTETIFECLPVCTPSLSSFSCSQKCGCMCSASVGLLLAAASSFIGA